MGIEAMRNRVMDQAKSRWWYAAFVVLVCLLACSLYYYFFVKKTYVEIELSVAQRCDFKIYWAKGDDLYAEENMSVVIATPERRHYTMFLPNIEKINRLRIDTHNYPGEATLHKLVLRQEGYEPIVFSAPEHFKVLKPLFQVEAWDAGGEGMWVKSSGNDPTFEFLPSPQPQPLDLLWLAVRLIGISALVVLFMYGAAPLAGNLRFVPMLLFGVWLLVLAMAGTSKENGHPDEYVHLSATAYYEDHWLPPVIEDPAIRHTYSVYGVSRLNNGEVYYLFSGKFTKFAKAFKIPDYFAKRTFNLFLFGLILLYAVRNRYARMAALPFLVSPQVWYIFSYCCSDAFALFFCFLAACQVIDPESLLHRCLKGESWMGKVAGAVAVGLILGVIFLLKKNYYPFIAFFYISILAMILFTNQFYWEKKEAVLRLALVTLIGLGVFGARLGADYWINGLDRNDKIFEMQKELAIPWFNPNTDVSEKHPSINRKDRGVTIPEIIHHDRWFERVFRTSFGVYGYFTISGTDGYYNLVRWTGVALLAFLFGTFLVRGGLVGGGLATVAFGLGVALIAVALHHSWTVDFQAQGRYLFPILPMLGIVYGINHEVVHRRLFLLLFLPMFSLGVYSFIFEGLMRIPRVIFT